MSKLSRFITSAWGPSYPAAVCTIDFALWDLVGKIMNQPVYQLLGGKAVDKLRFEYYVRPDASPTGVVKAVAQAEELVAGGVTCLGIKSTGFGGQEQSMEKDIATVKEITKKFGDKAEVAFDANASLNYYEALQLGRELDDCGMFKYEQPVATADIEGLAALRNTLKTPICSHESSVLIPGMIECIKKKAVDILGTKLAPAGGITEGLKWGAIAKESHLGIYCGAMNRPWEAAAQAHWLCTDTAYSGQAHANYYPLMMYNTLDTTKSVNVDCPLKPNEIQERLLLSARGPGLGLELNKAVPKYLTKGKSIVAIG